MADEFLTDLRDLSSRAVASAAAGGKAVNLSRLLAAGVRVPPGFAIDAEALTRALGSREAGLREPFEQAVQAAARRLQGPLVVRSSASIEDSPETAAPGIFRSLRDVCHGPDLIDAVRTVWESARAPAAASYAAARQLDLEALRMAVVVQTQVGGSAAGVIYTRHPGRPDGDTALLEARIATDTAKSAEATQPGAPSRAAAELRRDNGEMVSADPDFPVPSDRLAEIASAAIAAERAIGADHGADVEWVLAATGVWIVQARPLPRSAHTPTDRAPPLGLFAFSQAAPGEVWRWDASHNPEPLSPAQAGLVRRVDEARLAPFRMRVIAGYLYATETPPDARPTSTLSGADLRSRFDSEIGPRIERALAVVEREASPDLRAALRAYDEVYRVYASVLTPLLTDARRALPGLLAHELGDERSDAIAVELLAEQPGSVLERLLAPAAAGELSFDELLELAGPLSPVWDVAVASYGEEPDVLARSVTRYRTPRPLSDTGGLRARVRADLRPEAAHRFDEAVDLARAAREIGDADDLLFGRAQYAVRRALLALAKGWRLRETADVFYAPFDRILEAAERGRAPAPDELHALAETGRRVWQDQRTLAMPLAVRNGRPLTSAHNLRAQRDCWQGRGLGGRVHGTVVRVDDLQRADTIPNDAVLVAPTITPAMALSVAGVTCVVTEHGGLLDHGAALARELGVPCVVGCAGVWTNLGTGDRVWVDGQAGVVVRMVSRDQ